jgi:hypothetical protein
MDDSPARREILAGPSGEDFEMFALGRAGQIGELGGGAGLICDRLADALIAGE